jgi:hypothetical protein
MPKNRRPAIGPLTCFILLAILTFAGPTQVQSGGQNPTPIVISLTPPTPTPAPTEAEPSPTSETTLPPDRFEPNDEMGTATVIGLQTESELTLTGNDLDYFTLYLKQGQLLRADTGVSGGLDSRLKLYFGGQWLAENDDRGPADVGSRLTWAAAADGWYVILVEKATIYDGVYSLALQLIEPTPTATSSPTPTPTPTSTPSTTPTSTSLPTPTAPVQPGLPTPAMPGRPSATPVAPVATPVATGVPITLSVTYVGRAEAPAATTITAIRLLVYYDANNDRSPGPGEGIANVSVLAVDAQGQRIARVFTNAQGEAIFNLVSETVARVIVPFVPAWSAPVRVGEANPDIVLGLPAVRLPVFLPVQNQPNNEE